MTQHYKFVAAGATDVGRRRNMNEDALFVSDDLLIVCDGMGGHDNGEVASALTVETLVKSWIESDRSGNSLVKAIVAANKMVTEWALDMKSDMGTTLNVSALVTQSTKPRLVNINIGDSQARIASKKSDWDEFKMFASELHNAPRSSSAITRFIPSGWYGPPNPLIDWIKDSYHRISLEDKIIRLAMFSDGYGDYHYNDALEIIDEIIGDVSDEYKEDWTEEELTEGCQEAIQWANDCGGKDNITMILAQVVSI